MAVSAPPRTRNLIPVTLCSTVPRVEMTECAQATNDTDYGMTSPAPI